MYVCGPNACISGGFKEFKPVDVQTRKVPINDTGNKYVSYVRDLFLSNGQKKKQGKEGTKSNFDRSKDALQKGHDSVVRMKDACKYWHIR